MLYKIFIGIIIPFIGTLLGSSGVFFMKRHLSSGVERALSAVAGGIMVAASIWSLLIPSLELTSSGNSVISSVLQTASGFIFGVLLMIWADKKICRIYSDQNRNSNCFKQISNNTLTQFIAITLHNIPEGMAVGMVYSALLNDETLSGYSTALVLSLGIAAQNIPEGAIISMPLHAQGKGKFKAFILSALSGIVEPIGAVIAIVASRSIGVLLPVLLSSAAGAMVYVVTEQLIPEMYCKSGKMNSIMTVLYAIGFLLMMSLDVIFG